MSSLLNFIASTIGLSMKSPGGLGGQCVDLVELWLLTLDAPTVPGNATDLWANAPGSHYMHVLNGPTNAPRPGDVVIWHRAPAVGIGPAGHCAVAVLADGDRLLTLDQNWPEKASTALVVHQYAGVTGWLRPVAWGGPVGPSGLSGPTGLSGPSCHTGP